MRGRLTAHCVRMPITGAESWTVVDKDFRPVDLDTFAMTTGPVGGHCDHGDAFDLRGLPPQLRLEVA